MNLRWGWLGWGVTTAFLASAEGDFRHGQPAPTARAAADYVPNLAALAKPATSELRDLVERYRTDRDALLRYYSVDGSSLHRRRLQEFHQA